MPKQKKNYEKILSVRLSSNEVNDIDRLCSAIGKSRSAAIRMLISLPSDPAMFKVISEKEMTQKEVPYETER